MRANVLFGLLTATAVGACSGSSSAETQSEPSTAPVTSQATPSSDASTPTAAIAAPATGHANAALDANTSSMSATAQGGACVDACPATGAGVTVGCEKRFMTGVNYAWKNWAADFGGSSLWGEKGVAGNEAAIKSDLTDMQSHGVDVVRWWMLQQLAGDGVTFDASGTPTGTGGTLVADVQAALDLAAQVGVHYQFTLFSFDDFAPDGTTNGAPLHGLKAIATDPTKRAALMNVIKTIAQTIEASPHKDRVVSWDVINEPEWVISGSDPYGDPAFSPNTKYESVTFAQMETFVSDVAKTLHANSAAPVTVGSAAIKWPHAFSHAGLDYYTFHMYDWVNQYYPYDKSLASYGVTDKPAVLGEFPLEGLAAANGQPAVPLSTMMSTLFSSGYAGAMPWAVDDSCCGSWSTAKSELATFANAHACMTHY